MRWFLPVLIACAEADERASRQDPSEPTAPPGAENVLIVVIDDIGIDKIGAYGKHAEAPPTPVMDALAAEGVRFEYAYAHPTCTPTRAALLTGQYASRSELGSWIEPWSSDARLDPMSLTLPRVVATSPDHAWSNAAVGKWHLAGFLTDSPGDHPLACGFSTHSGSLANPSNAIEPQDDEPRGYFRWEKSIDGELTWSDRYMTTDTVDDAIVLAETLAEPWLLYVAFNAAHTPLHVPPQRLLAHSLPDTPSDAEIFDAMVTALDTELGRLLTAIDTVTAAPVTTMLIGDNGTPSHAIRPPLDPARSKGTVAEGGVRVPFIVAGPRVGLPGAVARTPVHVVDVLPTVAAIAGVSPGTLTDAAGQPWLVDGLDLTPILADPETTDARLLYSEMFSPNGPPPWSSFARTLRDAEYKLIETPNAYAFFRLNEGLDEGDDLLPLGLDPAEQAAFESLQESLGTIAPSW